MRIAAITDIHANLPALEAVLEALEEAGVDEIWCLGDVLGYGAEPDACAALVRERCAIALVGNHDLAVLGALDVASFSEAAAVAVEWTRDNVSEETLAFLRDLEPQGTRQGIGLFHASPRDPVWEYVLSSEQADAGMDASGQRLGLIGHSHVALFFNRPAQGSREETRGAQASDGALLDLDGGEWLINPGSVGQPRDGDPRASWLELDTEAETALFHRAPYEIERAAKAIAAAGLPSRLADRLHTGQ
ncbi:MAG TPA: metallophosphoesterase family protein [Solirubrobacterales bacterium]|nr:metallophosphoesterase family protein [Solirubrobacterales bacterium]